jgi:hypothetical protein
MKHLYLLAALLSAHLAKAQEQPSLLDLLGEETRVDYATASFKTTRIINAQSIENVASGVLDLKISHRFGTLNSGAYDLFGLDNAFIRLGLDYGITDNLMVGLGRSTFQKAIDGFVKYRLLRQQTGSRIVPVTVTWHSAIAANMLRWSDPERDNRFAQRLAYTHQLLIGSKLSNSTSLMLLPTLVHRNLVATRGESNDVWALGIGGRQKVTRRIALTAEYFHVLPNQLTTGRYNPLSLGIDVETGGHVFQLHFTNSTGVNDPAYLTETTGQWGKGDIHFGFNVSRVFTVRDRTKAP